MIDVYVDICHNAGETAWGVRELSPDPARDHDYWLVLFSRRMGKISLAPADEMFRPRHHVRGPDGLFLVAKF